jgi:hypothetical protein
VAEKLDEHDAAEPDAQQGCADQVMLGHQQARQPGVPGLRAPARRPMA